MIKSDKNVLLIKGYLPEIIVDYMEITDQLHEKISDVFGKEQADKLLQDSLKICLMNDDEANQCMKDEIEKMKSEIFSKLITKLFNEAMKEK